MKASKFFEKFSLYELVLTAVMAALGIAIKPLVVPLAHIVCGPLMIPSGALAGGLYMMWLVIGYGLVRKPGTALIISIIQALLVIFTGVIGSHGIMSLVTYIAPGLAVEIVMLVSRIMSRLRDKKSLDSRQGGKHIGIASCAVASLFANMTGTACVNIIFFRVPGLYLILILSVAAVSGIIGGVIGWKIIEIFTVFEMKRNGGKEAGGWCSDVDVVMCQEATDLKGSRDKVTQEAFGVTDAAASSEDGLISSTNDNSTSPISDEVAGNQGHKGLKFVIALTACLLIIGGVSLGIYTAGNSNDNEAEISVMIEGEPKATFTMKEIMKMKAQEKYVNLSSANKKDAIGEFKGATVKEILSEGGINIRNADSKYSAVLLTAGDGYSAAADLDEIDEVLVAYSLDGETLGYLTKGGTGPFRAVFTKDTYGNRSVMNLIKIDLRK